jgi:uncharacterized protein YyaL (SSP411 family)
LSARDQRVKPGLDDKTLTSWNGLMIIAMCSGYRILGDYRFLESARKAARFILDKMIRDGRLMATYREGRARFHAYLDDYAFLIGGLIELYESDFDSSWLEEATRLADSLVDLFWDDAQGGFFFTGSDHESLLVRPKPAMDAAIPSGNAMAATYFLKLSTYTGAPEYATRAQETLRAYQGMLQRFPSAFAQMLCAVDYYLGDKRELALIGSEGSPLTREALRRIWRVYSPNSAIAFLDPAWPNRQAVEDRIPLLGGKRAGAESPVFYLCKNYACDAPTENLENIEAALRQ